MHMGLERCDLRIQMEVNVAIGAHHFTGGNVDQAHALPELLRPAAIFRFITLRMKYDTEFDHRISLHSYRVEVIGKPYLAIGLQQDARVVRIDFGAFAGCILHQKHRLFVIAVTASPFRVGKRVMYNPPGGVVWRSGLDCLDVPVSQHPSNQVLGVEIAIQVRTDGRHRIIPRHDYIWFTDTPLRGVGEFQLQRHVGGIALWRTGICPGREHRDLCGAQRPIVLKFLNTDVPVDVPGRHGAVRGLIFDQRRKRTHLLIGHKRHRRHSLRAMTVLTGHLQNRHYVPREGRVFLGGLRRCQFRQRQCCDGKDEGRQGAPCQQIRIFSS